MDGLTRDVGRHAVVLRVNRRETVGAEVARRWEVRLVPALLLFDGTGEVVWRQEGSLPQRRAVRQRILALQSAKEE